jgi:hypothetical protein
MVTRQAVVGGLAGPTVSCPDGKRVLGGGMWHNAWGGTTEILMSASAPNSAGTGWTVLLQNTSSEMQEVTVYAICASV